MNKNCWSLCHDVLRVLTMAITGDLAIDQIFRVIWEQSQASFDEEFNFISYYNWTGGNGALSPAVPNGGNGEPKGYTGLVGTHHRPSDDISTFGTSSSSHRALEMDSQTAPAFLTPANAMLSVELTNLANILDAAHHSPNVSKAARSYSSTIKKAIWDTTVVNNIFAYETNGLGSRYVMDDANVPVGNVPVNTSSVVSDSSLVSPVAALPWLPRQTQPSLRRHAEVAPFSPQPVLRRRQDLQWHRECSIFTHCHR
jgi:hypothetical protein